MGSGQQIDVVDEKRRRKNIEPVLYLVQFVCEK